MVVFVCWGFDLRLRLLIACVFCSLLLLGAVPPGASAQSGCATIVVASGADWVAADNGISNAIGYSFRQVSGEADTVDMQYFDDVWITLGVLSTSFATWTVDPTFRLHNNADEMSFEYCASLATPTATSAPTATSEVLVTPTPVPTATPDPSIALQERADQSFQLQIFSTAVFIGLAFWFFMVRK